LSAASRAWGLCRVQDYGSRCFAVRRSHLGRVVTIAVQVGVARRVQVVVGAAETEISSISPVGDTYFDLSISNVLLCPGLI
jgi:hypothetical protein